MSPVQYYLCYYFSFSKRSARYISLLYFAFLQLVLQLKRPIRTLPLLSNRVSKLCNRHMSCLSRITHSFLSHVLLTAICLIMLTIFATMSIHLLNSSPRKLEINTFLRRKQYAEIKANFSCFERQVIFLMDSTIEPIINTNGE